MITILTEKPSAARNFAKALGGKAGTFEGAAYEIVNSVGHIMRFPTEVVDLVSEENKDRYGRWNLEYLPWSPADLAWKRELDPEKKDVYAAIKASVANADEVIIATDNDPTGEGTLLAAEILVTLNLKGKKLSRMFFEDETPKNIQQAFRDRVDIPALEADRDFVKADYRSKWDYMSMQFTRVASGVLRESTGKFAVLRNGRLKSFMVVYVGDGLKALAEYKKAPFYQPAFRDENGNWFTKKNAQTFAKAEEVSLEGLHESPVQIIATERKSSAPPKLLDLAGLSSRLAPMGIKSKDVLSVYQKMYEDSVVSYPRTEDKEVTPEQFAEYTREKVMRIANVVGADTSLLTHFEARPTHVKAGGAHGATRPSASNIPGSLEEIEGKYGTIGRKIYELLSLSFLSMYGEDYTYDKTSACVSEFPEYKAEIQVPVSYGYKAIFNDKDDDEEEKPSKAFGATAVPAVKEGFTKAPPTPTLKWLMKGLEKYNVGTGATRTSIFAEVTNQNAKYPLMTETKGKLGLTEFGDIDYRLVKGTSIGGAQFTERLQQEMKMIATGEITEPMQLLENVAGYVLADLAVMRANVSQLGDVEPDGPKPLGKCPHCGGNVVDGKYGPYCTSKCGMRFTYFGKALTAAQVTKLLSGKKVVISGLTSKAGNKYSMEVSAKGVKPYTKSDGTVIYTYEFEGQLVKPAAAK